MSEYIFYRNLYNKHIMRATKNAIERSSGWDHFEEYHPWSKTWASSWNITDHGFPKDVAHIYEPISHEEAFLEFLGRK